MNTEELMLELVAVAAIWIGGIVIGVWIGTGDC